MELQRLIRGSSLLHFSISHLIGSFLARRKVKKILANALEERMKDNRLWGALTIQRIARGYIARNSIVRSVPFRERNAVSHSSCS
jgi:hypothetical protein